MTPFAVLILLSRPYNINFSNGRTLVIIVPLESAEKEINFHAFKK
jgi:hypothetical protein